MKSDTKPAEPLTTIAIPQSLHRRFRKKAVNRGKTIGQALREAMAAWMKEA